MNDEMTTMRSIFMVLAPPGDEPTAVNHYVPANQRLLQVVQTMIALRQMVKPDVNLGTADLYLLSDLYHQPIDPGILVCQVPFPGCVFVVFKAGKVEVDGEMLSGEEGALAVARSYAMALIRQRKDEDDKLAMRYARFIENGDWRFDPTPITSHDLGLTYHQNESAIATRLLEQLAERKLRCRSRCVTAGASSPDTASAGQPTDDVRALAVLVSPETQHDAWIAFDVGAAWARGIPVVPILVGDWTEDPPSILAPYQQLKWDTQQERVVEQIVAMLGLTPWEMPVQDESGNTGKLNLTQALELAQQKAATKSNRKPAGQTRPPAARKKAPRKKAR